MVFKTCDGAQDNILCVLMSRHDVIDEMWNRLSSLLPPERSGKQGRPCHDRRRIVNGMLWILRIGAPWREDLRTKSWTPDETEGWPCTPEKNE